MSKAVLLGIGGGRQPVLFTPELSVDYGLSKLKIVDGNGDFATYEIYAEESGEYLLVTETVDKVVDLNALFPNCNQDVYIKVKAVEKDFISSDFSNVVVWEHGIGTLGLEYTLSQDGTYYICSGIGTATETDIEIGSIHEYLPVLEIAKNAFYRNSNITGVIIPSSILSIGEQAFSYCGNLSNVVFREGCQLGRSSYQFATSLLKEKTYYLPDSITFIGICCFEANTQWSPAKRTKFILGKNVSSIETLAFRKNSRLSIIIETQVPPTFGTDVITTDGSYGVGGNRLFVPYVSIDQYKIATNVVQFASLVYPLVSAVADLADIDATVYTKACVIGNKEYQEYIYENGQWVIYEGIN